MWGAGGWVEVWGGGLLMVVVVGGVEGGRGIDVAVFILYPSCICKALQFDAFSSDAGLSYNWSLRRLMRVVLM